MATISCTTCAAKLKLPEGTEAQAFQCPKCGSLIDSDAARSGETKRGASSLGRRQSPSQWQSAEDSVSCRYCGERVLAHARKCKHCGEILDPDLRKSRRDEREVHHHVEEKSSAVAVLLEVLPGLFFQTFGIGHLYAGNTGTGLAFMLGYWAVTALNVGLMFCFIGFVTWPLCWLICLILSPILAAQYCNQVNARNARRR